MKRKSYHSKIFRSITASFASFAFLFIYFLFIFSFVQNPGTSNPAHNLKSILESLNSFSVKNSGGLILSYMGLGQASPQHPAVRSSSPLYVVPGGQSIGIMMHSRGVMVVGMSNITDANGKSVNPAEKAGVKLGDVITSANSQKIINEYQLKNEISKSGQKDIVLGIKRGKEELNIRVSPIVCRETNRPRIGLFVRDSASGVGTLSFHHSESLMYGALGHIIADVDTSKGIDLMDGRILEAGVRAIHRGKRGQPGEKVGIIVDDGSISGNIERNTRYGIYGRIQKIPDNPHYPKPIPVAMANQIEKGPAEILTVIEGTEIGKYTVEIQEIIYPWRSKEKGMVIKVTDSNLINVTGGIIQGMSGSPIIQNGKLVGVVTHVFVNDPQRGYGIPAEWMLREMGLLNDKN